MALPLFFVPTKTAAENQHIRKFAGKYLDLRYNQATKRPDFCIISRKILNMANTSYVGTRWAFKSKSADTFRIIHQTGNNATPTPPGDTMLTLIPWHGGQPFAIPLAVLSEYYFPVRRQDVTIPGGTIDDHNETAE